MVLNLLNDFMKNELKGRYEVWFRYDYQLNAVSIEMRDGLLRYCKIISISEFGNIGSKNYEAALVDILRSMVEHIDGYRKEERKRLGG